MANYPDDFSLEQARRLYFERNGFGAAGGYDDEWVHYRIGPLPFPLPNTAARVRAVRYHDLHHIVTGYETTLTGETEIAAWEIATGCAFFPAALHLNLAAVGLGTFFAPLKVFRAYARGRRSTNLYGRYFGPRLLSLSVGRARGELGLDRPGVDGVTIGDIVRFVVLAPFSVAVALITLIIALPLALIAWPFLLNGSHKSRRLSSSP
jgi:hypothetical protein